MSLHVVVIQRQDFDRRNGQYSVTVLWYGFFHQMAHDGWGTYDCVIHFSILDMQNDCICCISYVMVAHLMSSSQLKHV